MSQHNPPLQIAAGKPAKRRGKPRGKPFEKGEDSRRNREPPPPGPGRPAADFTERMRNLCASTVPEEILVPLDEKTREQLLRHAPTVWLQVMNLRLRAFELVAERGFNKPTAGDPHAAERPILILER